MSPLPSALTADELAMRLRQQQLVAEFGLLALEPGPSERLLDAASRVASEGLETKFAKVLQRRSTGDLLVVAGVGWHAGVVGHSTLGGGLDSPAGFALHTGQPTLANHLAKEDRFRVPALLAEHGIQSAINVVVGTPGRDAFGVLEVDSTRRHEFSDPDTSFLQSLANILAAGLARVAAEQAKDELLRDKDLLMREVHHRVTNSLQLVRTMLGLQARNVSFETRAELDVAAGRIMSIAAVHRRLYESGSVLEADAVPYLRGLLDEISAVVADDRRIELVAEPAILSADVLTPLGLVISELATNAIKHASGATRMKVGVGEGFVTIEAEDEGTGFPEPAGGPTGLGMRLISTLARGGSVEIDRTVRYGRVVVRLKL